MRRHLLVPLWFTLLLSSVFLSTVPHVGATGALDPLNDPLLPPAAGGVARADRLLAKLTGHRRLLVIGAHPDDEDTTLIAYVARALGGEAAYLSLSRGEGGQNLIGPELGVELGLLRSRELLAARGIDGGRQFFTRAFDFGYTRSLAETFERWPRQVLLEDTVRVIRRFRPQVVVSVFPPDERAGHGQHQAAGVVAGEAYELAGDADAFAELVAEGLSPWRPQALYRGAWWRPEEATLTIPLGVLEGVGGRSIYQIAMASRSQHRCQDMGRLQPLGPFTGRLAWERGGAPPGEAGWSGGEDSSAGDLFAGIDTRLAAMAEPLAEPARTAVGERLARVEELARRARAELTAADPSAVLPLAAAIHRELTAAHRAVESGAAPGPSASARPAGRFGSVADLIEEKRAVAAELLATVAGLGLDAFADRDLLVAGSELFVETAAWDAGGSGAELLDVRLTSANDFPVEPAEIEDEDSFESRFRDTAEPGYFRRAFRVHVPPDTPPTVPYFLAAPQDGDLYDWRAAPPPLRGEPFAPPPLVASFRLRLAGEEIDLVREVVHRREDQALGEVRRGLRVVPPLEVSVARDLLVWPTDRGEPHTLEVTLTSHAAFPLAGRLEASAPDGWRASTQPFHLPAENARSTVRLTLQPSEPVAPGEHPISVTAVVECAAGTSACDAEGRYDAAVPLVDYSHVRATPYPRPAAVRVVALDLALPPVDRIGYVRGAADRVPEALLDVGLPVELLDPTEPARRDLSRFDAIVIGARAFEVSPALGNANPLLLDYARAGGLVIVQYQQYDYSTGGYAPYPLEIARPHGRVTDETAPVTVLEPDSPVLTTPNGIGPGDWDGWVQERGLYMPSSWGEPFRPLLAIADPGEEPQRGALLVAPVGEGTYVYTGLAFFRQLPAGVPGAYRLFANLLALAHTRDEDSAP